MSLRVLDSMLDGQMAKPDQEAGVTYPLQNQSLATAALATVLSLSMFASACDNGDDSTAADESNTGSASDSAEGENARKTGTITVGSDTWTVVPSTQCSVYPGDVVSIAGHAPSDEAIEIVLDYDPSSELIQAYVKGPDDSPYWIAADDDISFEIDGKTVAGSGTFSVGLGARVEEGQPRQAEGSFEINC